MDFHTIVRAPFVVCFSVLFVELVQEKKLGQCKIALFLTSFFQTLLLKNKINNIILSSFIL